MILPLPFLSSRAMVFLTGSFEPASFHACCLLALLTYFAFPLPTHPPPNTESQSTSTGTVSRKENR